ncbi:unnamed protein product [Vitrella brassicaformis CCMP3155]|uniref:Uncharacterized protein n=2 Tax=Vitrella brassicaformis TaxID=1169539 RepID=A0A0G4ELM5_VITBC|nr:unnamed protein product [Vitrella brassicaformis CCMP3155]|eukprot:CEL97919.1 unnamed protein product [Vitrella brassicaformis CCMP3155]
MHPAGRYRLYSGLFAPTALKESLFKESDGLLQSIRQSCADKSKPLPDARLYGLNTCAKFIWRCGRDAGLQHHMPAILRSGFGLFQKDESKRVKRAALYLMLEVIKCNARCGSPLSAQEMEIDKHIGRLMEELKSFRTKMGPQAQGALYALFAGMIDLYDNHFSPQQLRDIASTIKTVMESSMSNLSKGFEPSLIEGVMKGLESLLHRHADAFFPADQPDHESRQRLYTFIEGTANYVQGSGGSLAPMKAAMSVLRRHAQLFRGQLLAELRAVPAYRNKRQEERLAAREAAKQANAGEAAAAAEGQPADWQLKRHTAGPQPDTDTQSNRQAGRRTRQCLNT